MECKCFLTYNVVKVTEGSKHTRLTDTTKATEQRAGALGRRLRSRDVASLPAVFTSAELSAEREGTLPGNRPFSSRATMYSTNRPEETGGAPCGRGT